MTWPPLLIVWAMFTLSPVTISVYPPFAMVHAAMFRMTVLAPRHQDNRALCLGYKVPGEREFLRNSCQSMDGLMAVRVRTVYWEIRAAGEFEAIADLTRVEDGTTRHYISRQPFRVIGADPLEQ